MDSWREVSIGEILTKEQLTELKRVIREHRSYKRSPLEPIFINSLKTLFRKWDKQLIAKGVDPEYLAYAVSYTMNKNPERFWEMLKEVT